MVIVIIITIDLHVCTSALARGNTSYCGLIYSSSEGSFHSDADTFRRRYKHTVGYPHSPSQTIKLQDV